MKILVRELPTYIIYTDARKLGSGGVIMPGLEKIPYWVWQYQWQMYIQQSLITEENPMVTLKINVLELVGMVLGWLVLGYVWNDLIFKHVSLLCDNTSTVAWAYKGSMYTSLPTGLLLRLLPIWKKYRQKYLLVPQKSLGKENSMVDIPYKVFKKGGLFHAQADLETYFNLHSTLPQKQSR